MDFEEPIPSEINNKKEVIAYHPMTQKK